MRRSLTCQVVKSDCWLKVSRASGAVYINSKARIGDTVPCADVAPLLTINVCSFGPPRRAGPRNLKLPNEPPQHTRLLQRLAMRLAHNVSQVPNVHSED